MLVSLYMWLPVQPNQIRPWSVCLRPITATAGGHCHQSSLNHWPNSYVWTEIYVNIVDTLDEGMIKCHTSIPCNVWTLSLTTETLFILWVNSHHSDSHNMMRKQSFKCSRSSMMFLHSPSNAVTKCLLLLSVRSFFTWTSLKHIGSPFIWASYLCNNHTQYA